jgi:2-polyprenyl-3-methyl-5-hydroxy-6-metoxy-1,4-benzoquinol methylase
MAHRDRSVEKEWIDLGGAYYSPEEYRDCLYKLDRVGRLLGGNRATYWAFKRLRHSPKSILDVGCGGGLFTQELAKLYPECHVTGIDTSKEAIQFAQQHLYHPLLKNIEFSIPPKPQLEYPAKSIDVITATLVCHHLSDEELVLFLKESYKIANHAIILNDLHRHPLARLGFALLTPFFFRNRVVAHDGQLSIKRAFIRKEWIKYLQMAGIPLERCSVTWHWAFRWIVFIDTSKSESEL